MNLDEVFPIGQGYKIGKYTIHEAERMPATLAARDILAQSSNIGTSQIALRGGGARQKQFLAHMGLLSPIKTEDLSGLAPAIVVTAGFDPLVDQGECYAKRLKDAGVPVIYRCYDSLAHGFTAFTGAVPAADIACREVAGLVREGLEGRIC